MAFGSDESDMLDALTVAVDRGEPEAMQQLITAIYPELKRLAHSHLSHERPDHTLNTTAVVHEAYLRLAERQNGWSDHKYFLRSAAMVMRHLLVDHARRRNAAKHGDGKAPLPLDEQRLTIEDDSVAVLALDDAIDKIAEIDPRLQQVIECRFFAGMSVADTAEALGLTTRTVERDWQRARGYLLRKMDWNG